MTTAVKDLTKDIPVEERARILNADLKSKGGGKEIGKKNGGTVFDIQQYGDLHVGDRVRYINVLGEQAVGYVSHFFMRDKYHKHSLLETLGEVARAFGINSEIPRSIIPVMTEEGWNGYSLHNSAGLLTKL